MALILGSQNLVSADVKSTPKALLAEWTNNYANETFQFIFNQAYLIGTNKTPVSFAFTNATPATTEGSQSFNYISNFSMQVTSATSYTIRAGRRLILLGLSVAVKNAGAAVQGVIARVRVNKFIIPDGTTPVDSIVAEIGAGTFSAVANNVGSNSNTITGMFPAHMEWQYPAKMIITLQGVAAAGVDFCAWGFEY